MTRYALIPAVLAGPVAADECSDYRVAFMLREAASDAFSDIAEKAAPKFEGSEFQAPDDALQRTTVDLHHAAEGVRRTIDGRRAAVLAIDAMHTARTAIANALHDWIRVEAGLPVYIKIVDAAKALSAAYHEALHFACRESTP